MPLLNLSKEERGIVVFKVWQSLDYNIRISLSFGLILLGFIIQYFTEKAFPCVIILFIGNLFLLVSGYDNRINFKGYMPAAKWEKIDKNKLLEFERFEKIRHHPEY